MGNIVIAKRGECNFLMKAMMAKMAGGAIGLIVVNNVPDTLEIYMIGPWHQQSPGPPGSKCTIGGPPDGNPPGCAPNPGLPALAMQKEKGEELIKLLQSSTVVLELKTGEIQPGDFKARRMLLLVPPLPPTPTVCPSLKYRCFRKSSTPRSL